MNQLQKAQARHLFCTISRVGEGHTRCPSNGRAKASRRKLQLLFVMDFHSSPLLIHAIPRSDPATREAPLSPSPLNSHQAPVPTSPTAFKPAANGAYRCRLLQYPRDRDEASSNIPPNTNVLFTHGPPWGHLDGAKKSSCRFLTREVAQVRPQMVVFGHTQRLRH